MTRLGALLDADGNLLAAITKPLRALLDVGFSADGRYAVLAGSYVANNLTSGALVVLDAQSGQFIYPTQILTGSGMLLSLTFHPTAPRLATVAEDKTIRLWEIATGKPTTLLTHTTALVKIHYSADGQTLYHRPTRDYLRPNCGTMPDLLSWM